MTVRLSIKAAMAVVHIRQYITEGGNPLNAYRYIERLLDFIEALKNFPEKFPLCKHPPWRKRQYHCTTFENTYVIAYKIYKQHITVKEIRQGAKVT